MLGSTHKGPNMPTSADYADRVKRYLKAELKRAGVGYKELAERMTAMGLQESEGSITVKINRGAFPAWFLVAAMEAIGASTLRLD
jgi:Domain of unknown function (DUF6471)